MRKTVLCFGLIALFLVGNAMAATEEAKKIAIDDGLAWLAATQTTSGAEGYWSYGNDGTLATTAAAALAFIEAGYWPGGKPLYDDVITRAVTYIFNRAAVDGRFGVETAVYWHYAEDYNNNGVDDFGEGNDSTLYFNSGNSTRNVYTTGIVVPVVYALGESLGINTPVGIGSAAINGKTYRQAMRDIVDWFSWGQVEPNMGSSRGGWRYDANYGSSDNSTAQWGALPLLYASAWGLPVPQYVFDELELWVNYIQNANGGSGYDSPGNMVNISKTGGLLLELAAIGAGQSDTRVQAALNFINVHWNEGVSSWDGNFNNAYAMWALFKGLQVQGYLVDFNCGPPLIDPISIGEGIPAAPGGFTICSELNPTTSAAGDWYSHYCDYLVGLQNANGSWSGAESWTGPLATGWYINILRATEIPHCEQLQADAGRDSTFECSGSPTTAVTLDGTGSKDGDGGPSPSLFWSAPGVTFDDPTSPTPVGQFPLGTTTVMLIAVCTQLPAIADTDSVNITIEDTTPPDIVVELNRDVLWPPNHKMVDITATVTVTDACCDAPTFTLVSITSNEPDNGKGDGNTIDDIQGADPGTADVAFQLRSERSGLGDGRIYTIVYEAEDCVGHTAFDTVAVRVPHDHSGWALASLGYAADGSALERSLPSFVLVIPSRGAQFGVDEKGNSVVISEPFDATKLDAKRIYVGNTVGVITPMRSLKLDNNGDGFVDLALFYTSEAADELVRNSSTLSGDAIEIDAEGADGPVGLHYTDVHGVDYVVRDIFALGSAVPLGLPTDGKRRPDEQGGVNAGGRVSELLPSYPNPFNPTTTIPFEVAAQGRVTLQVFDTQGKLVRTLCDEVLPAGVHQAVWDSHDNVGRQVATGVYFVRLVTGDYRMTRKLVMIK
jgi:hypothetical protein